MERTVVPGPRGELLLECYESVLVLRASGHASASQAKPFIRAADALFPAKTHRPALFYDFGALKTYDSEFRQALTQHYAAHRHEAERPCLLTGSKLVAMGTAVANLALGGAIVTFTDRPSFEAELRRTLAAR